MKDRGAGRLKCSRAAPLLSRVALARVAAKMGRQRLRRRDRLYQHPMFHDCRHLQCGFLALARPCGGRRAADPVRRA